MSKEIVGIVLDGRAFHDDPVLLQRTVGHVNKILHRASIENRASDMSAVVLVGTAATSNQLDFSNVSFWGPFKRSVDRLAEWQRELARVDFIGEGDLLDGVVLCGDEMVKAMAGGKFAEAVVFVFSSRERIGGMVDLDGEGCEEVKSKLDEEGVEVLWVPVGEQERVQVPFGEVLTESSFTADFSFPLKRVRPTTLYKGQMTIGTLSVSVKLFNKTQVATVPRGKWIDGGLRSTGHFDKSTSELVQPERMVKAYKYGTDRIPFSLVDQAQLHSDNCGKGLSVIGFGLRSQLSRAAFLSTVMVIVPDGEDQAVFMALVEAMQLKGRVGLARYCRTEKAEPKLLYLLPNDNCLLAVTAPFAEDHRRWSFPPLPTCADEQTRVMSKLVDLYKGTHTLCLNPCIHHMWLAIRQRAVSGAHSEIPGVPVELISGLTPSSSSALAQECLTNLQNTLPITVVESAQQSTWHRTTSADTLSRFWTNPTAKDTNDDQTDDSLIAAFNRLVNDTTEDRVGEAMLMLMTHIPVLLYTRSTTDLPSALDQSSRCLRRLRQVATQHGLSLRYNAFVSELKRRAKGEDRVAKAFFEKAVGEMRLTLISENEEEASAVTPEEASEFMQLY